jgi:hypothetical protein
MSDVMERSGTAIVPAGGDPYSSYGAKVGLQGNFLTFKNGEFTYGQDAKTLPMGTRVAVNMPGVRIGWRRWYGGQLTDDLTELLADRPHIQTRNTLGDDDPSLWEKDQDGKARDPWSLSNVIEFIDSEGERYIYASGAKGAINAIGKLCSEYGKLYRQRPGQAPVIALACDSYMHPVYKKTFVPVFTPIVGWTDENALTIEEGDEAKEAAPEPQKGQRAANPTPAASAPSTAAGASSQSANGAATTTTSPSKKPRF